MQALSIAWDSRPKEQGGQHWFHLYPNEDDQARRCAALDQVESELEFHVRGVSFDRRAQELRCGQRSISIPHGRRSVWAARPATARARAISPGRATSKAGGRSGNMRTSPRASPFASMSAAMSAGDTIRQPATRSAISRRRFCARKSRPAGYATRAGRSSPRIGCPVSGCRIRMSFQSSAAGFITPTGRCRTKSTITARSSRARCLRPASPAAIATIRTAPS